MYELVSLFTYFFSIGDIKVVKKALNNLHDYMGKPWITISSYYK